MPIWWRDEDEPEVPSSRPQEEAHQMEPLPRKDPSTERKPDWWDGNIVPGKLSSDVSEQPPDRRVVEASDTSDAPLKKLAWVPADGSTVKPEEINWEIEGRSLPPLLEDISKEEEEDVLMGDEEELDEAIEAVGEEYQERLHGLAEAAKESPTCRN